MVLEPLDSEGGLLTDLRGALDSTIATAHSAETEEDGDGGTSAGGNNGPISLFGDFDSTQGGTTVVDPDKAMEGCGALSLSCRL
jgi:hypothetical protein